LGAVKTVRIVEELMEIWPNEVCDNVCFMGTKASLLLNELKQKFMARWECRDLCETTEFLGMHISPDCKN